MQRLIFVAFLNMYLVSISGCISISLIIQVSYSLHTPVYFLLAYFTALEICHSDSGQCPVHRENPHLPVRLWQIFFIFVGSTNCILLAIMSCDRFVAMCHPLHFTLTMSRQLCVRLALGSLVLGFILAMQLTVLMFLLLFCGSKEISLFYGHVLPVTTGLCRHLGP